MTLFSRILALFSIICFANAEDFITQTEYAKMLYANPRGIGCDQCHGSKGEGGVLATYTQKGEKKSLNAPPINNLSLEKFRHGILRQSPVMPSYFLTDEEIESLYYYVHVKDQNSSE
jgi:mono/diheme cytochrome c family protein